jgi:hypothetical protein
MRSSPAGWPWGSIAGPEGNLPTFSLLAFVGFSHSFFGGVSNEVDSFFVENYISPDCRVGLPAERALICSFRRFLWMEKIPILEVNSR